MPNCKRIELLSPAADLECGLAAINAGADAVYIGPPRFGARAKAGNPISDIAQLAKHAHLFGAKVYATLNTTLYDDELPEAQKIAWQLYNAGVDALIIQDMAWLQMQLPPIPLHASTQTDNRSPAKIQFLESCGVSRAILARELSLEEIATIKSHTTIELEAFIHGALCVSYSGQCYLSAFLGGRSANRGACAQPCRLPYDLVDQTGKCIIKSQHLLSLRDLNLTNRLKELIQAGVTTLKIEGRMKNRQYVQNITAHYNDKINSLLLKMPGYERASCGETRVDFTPDPQVTFARPFTEHFMGGRPDNLISAATPKSLGQHLGVVKAIGENWIDLATDIAIGNGDGLCILHNSKPIGFRANRVEGPRIYIYGAMPEIAIGNSVYRNSNQQASRFITPEATLRYLRIRLTLQEDSAGMFTLRLSDSEQMGCLISLGDNITIARNAAQQKATWQQQLAKSHDLRIVVDAVDVQCKRIPFLPIAKINALRRQLVTLYIERKSVRTPPPSCTNCVAPSCYPADEPHDYRLNITNKMAEQFYRLRGVLTVERAPEVTSNFAPNVELMRTRYCLRYELGACLRKYGARLPDPLFLQNGERRLRLAFDCTHCEMTIHAV